MRVSNSCDGCALRKVKCEAQRPCSECKARCLVCTSYRTQKKRGPKGLKPATARRVQEAQRQLQRQREQQQKQEQKQSKHPEQPQQLHELRLESPNASETDSSAQLSLTSPNDDSPSVALDHGDAEHLLPFVGPQCPKLPARLPLDTYCEILGLFDERLYPVWPVVSVEDLIMKLVLDANDYESWALAASLCAATIAQLRLQEHTDLCDASLSQSFSLDAQRLRECYDYRESCNANSLLTPFFLHMYFANAGKLRTAGVYLRESITYVHALFLDQPELHHSLDSKERSYKLRLFWLVFISERTYCAENGFPTVLTPISEMPPIEDSESDKNRITQAFASLIHLFAHLHGEILGTSPSQATPMDKQKIVASQGDLAVERHALVTSEIQQVDICVTQQWMRLLLWEYTMRHFIMTLDPKEHAFSLLLPITIAHKLLYLLSTVTPESIYAHGYGMELKVYRVADALMDLLACAPDTVREHGMLVGLEGILVSLNNLLLDVGGCGSTFLDKLHNRMANSKLSDCQWPYSAISTFMQGGFGTSHLDLRVQDSPEKETERYEDGNDDDKIATAEVEAVVQSTDL